MMSSPVRPDLIPAGFGLPPVPPRPDVAPQPPRRGWSAGRRRLIAGLVVLVVAAPVAIAIAASNAHPHGAYAFLQMRLYQPNEPFRWNPCEPIQYQVNTANAPAGAVADVAAVTARVTAATGVPFQFDGTTSRTATQQAADLYYSDIGHDTYDPVLVSWLPHPRFQAIVHEQGVLAFTRVVPGNDAKTSEQWTSGIVVVDAGGAFESSGRYSEPLVLQHEFGHVMGLGHVAEPNELMFSIDVAKDTVPYQMDDWGPGDLEGLELLGHDQGCLAHVNVAP
jgi:hypothetical protein